MKTIEKKEPYLHILNTRGNVYEEFLPDQVLTHKNLNKVVNYFEDQDRLSRIYLTGVGIGCGLNIVSYGNDHIEIGQGVGITTDGDLIKSETRRFQYYSPLTDKADYDLFRHTQGDMKVYEIYEQEAAGRPEDELPLTSFSINEGTTLKDCIVIAYVENYTEDEGLCGGSGCDETGNKVFSNLKFLITHKNNKDFLVGQEDDPKDTIYHSHNVLAYYDSLPDLCLPRIILTPTNTTSGMPIIQQYKDTFVLKDDLYVGISTIIRRFSQRINFKKYGVFITDIVTYLDTIFSDSDDEYVQYRYDLLKDLIDTYREIKNLILHCKFECVPNIKSFPKHLLLGTPDETTRLTTRHDFYPSPMVSENDENLIGIRTLCIKFYYQLKDFFILDYNTAQIKITPSKTYDYLLSERTIPYYYKSGRSLVNNWNPTSNENRKGNYQLAYNTGNLKDIDCVKNPLNYNHLDKDFYRIEGHQGKNYVTALKNILKKKRQLNLPFDVKAISVGFPVNNISLDEDTCETKEYVTLLETWEEEFNCVANRAIDFFRRYQTDTIGTNDTVADVFTVEVAKNDTEVEEAEEVEPVKGFGDGIKNDLQDDFAVAVNSGIKDVKLSFRDAKTTQRFTTATKADRITVASDIKTRFSTKLAYQRSLGFVAESVIADINPENLTADYVVAQVVSAYERLGSFQNVNTSSDDFKLYIEIPLRIITHLEIVKYRFIKELKDVYVTERWTAFHRVFGELCTEIEKIIFTISTAADNGTFGTKVHDNMYEFLVHKVAGLCCLKEKFNWLKTQLDDIRLNLYKELILSKFIEKHPGLEHMAGVPKGGTFLLVYLGEKQVTLEDDETIIETFDRKVLFDFALPYMCMSECAPATIVYSDIVDPVTLAIPRKKFCLPGNSEQVDFIIEPERGVVTSPDGAAFIITTAEGYAFDPTKVPDELLGEGIQFLVDGKVPTIPIETVVYKLPENVVASYEFVAWTDDGLVINLNVTHELEDLVYLQHTWKRNNGSEIALGKNPTNILILTEEILFQENITVVIDVIGNPVPCKLEIPVSIDEEREIIEVGVDMVTEICFNTQETSPTSETISVVPSEGTLTSPQEPITGQSFIELFEGIYSLNPLFVPDALAGEPITFAVDGIPVENFATRVYKIPGNITPTAVVISWSDTGANIRLTATHAYMDKSYLAYEWLNDIDEVIATSRVANINFPSLDGNLNTTVRVRVQVIGTNNELCTSADFPLVISEVRPEITTNIPPAFCWIENQNIDPFSIVVSDDGVEITCPQQEEAGIEFLQGSPGEYKLFINLLPNELIGIPILFQIDGQDPISTIVYKVPEGIEARYSNVSWSGNQLSIDIRAAHSLEGEIDTVEDYLTYTWRNGNNEVVLEDKERINFTIDTAEGNINEEYSLEVRVRETLIENPCGQPQIAMPIEEGRPDVIVTIVPEICHIEAQAGVLTHPISVTPSTFSVSSPDGSSFIEGTLGNYRINPALVPEELLGQPIRLVADGEVKATTIVYKLPELIRRNITVSNEAWQAEGLAVDLTSDVISRSYYNYQWISRVDGVETVLDKIAEPNRYLIPDNNDGVNVEVFLRLTADTDSVDFLCTQETMATTVRRHRPISVSKDRFCIPDTPVAFRGVNEDTGTLRSTNSSLPSDVITINSGRYIFNPNRVPESLYGVTLRFSVDGISQSGVAIRVYSKPTKESIIEDVQASTWVAEGYEFVFTHDLISKSYFSYQVNLKSTGEELQRVGTHRYLIRSQEGSINDQVVVTVSTPGISCGEDNTISVTTTRPDQPVGRLDCGTPYGSRLQILGTDTLLATLKGIFSRQPFEDSLRNDLLSPLDNVINAIVSSSNLNTIAEPAVSEINRLRNELMNKYYKNQNIDPSFYQSFLELDEIMELVVLELLRCVDNPGDNLFNAVDGFFVDSNTRNTEYSEKPRHTIDNTYMNGFNPPISSFKSKADTVFSTGTKRR